VRLKPDFAEAHTNLGTALALSPAVCRTRSHLKALRANPDFAPARTTGASATIAE
jgi:hypothetical protein